MSDSFHSLLPNEIGNIAILLDNLQYISSRNVNRQQSKYKIKVALDKVINFD